jgi:hypothetical protein
VAAKAIIFNLSKNIPASNSARVFCWKSSLNRVVLRDLSDFDTLNAFLFDPSTRLEAAAASQNLIDHPKFFLRMWWGAFFSFFALWYGLKSTM